MSLRHALVSVAVATACALGAAGCSDPAPPTVPPPSTTAVDTTGGDAGTRLMAPGAGETVGAALAATGDGPVTVTAYLFVYPDGTARLCDGTVPGAPPTCTDPSMSVLGLAKETVDALPSQDGLAFSAGTVTLMGRMRDGVFHNDPELLARS